MANSGTGTVQGAAQGAVQTAVAKVGKGAVQSAELNANIPVPTH